MLHWILHLLEREPKDGPELDLVFSDEIDSHVPVKTIRHNRFRIRVFRGKNGTCECCGRKLNWLSLDFLQKDNQWGSMLAVHERNLPYIIEAINELQEFLEQESEQATKHSRKKK